MLKIALICAACSAYGGCHALADEQEVPDLEFLEYLGSWDESDEDWVLFASDDDVQERHGRRQQKACTAGREGSGVGR